LWRDPPRYWEDIVFPAYVDAHKDLFEGGDIENGNLNGQKVDGLVLLETLNISMTEAAERSCNTIKSCLEGLYSL
jgi:nicotinamide/nicotinate riboside kinase